ncbi:radical SAM protein [Eubacteriaceae bacterium ES3]|nr:radical SAM protein [Eubacteriaceae bacterium ES3]
MDIISENIKNKVLLVYTQRLIRGRTFEMIESLGTLTLAAQLNQNGFEAKALTGITTDVMDVIKQEGSSLFAVCFYCDFDNRSAVAAIIKALKKEASFYILLGGPQTLHMTPEDKKIWLADAILKGEGEEILVEWLLAKRAGVSRRVSGEISDNQNSEYVTIKDFSPFALPEDQDKWNHQERPLLSVIAARGCPHRCAFCFEGGNSKTLRMREACDVLLEIETRLKESSGPRYLFFADDTFTTRPKRLKELLAGLKKLREIYDFVWFCEGHPGFLAKHPDLIKEMIKSGMVRMQIGMESGVGHVLDAYGKQASPEDVKKVVEICFEEGLPQLTGNFIIGGAFESLETLEQTSKMALEMLESAPGMLDLSTTFIMPLPGTQIYNNPESFGIILEDRECLTANEDFPVNHTKALSLAEICRERSRFITKISNRMKAQYQNSQLPKMRIKNDYQLAMRYGITSAYFKFLYVKDEKWHNYFKNLVLFDGILKEWEHVEISKIQVYTVQNVQDPAWWDLESLSDEELEILWSSGVLTIGELMEKLGWSQEKMQSCLEKMNRNGLILFSQSI